MRFSRGKSLYRLPKNFSHFQGGFVIVRGNYYQLMQIHCMEMEKIKVGKKMPVEILGIPTYYSIHGSGSYFEVWPTPDKAYSAKMDYFSINLCNEGIVREG